MKEYQVSYRGNRFVTRDNIIDVLNELGYNPGEGGGGFELNGVFNWYLRTGQGVGVQAPDLDLVGTEGYPWTANYQPPTANPDEKYVWKFTDFRYKDGSTPENPILHITVGPELITTFTSGGGMGVEFAYALFDKEVTEVILSEDDGELPVSEAPNAVPQEGGEWTKSLDSLSYDVDSYLWMSQRKISADGIPALWEKPIRLSGADGDPGADAFDTEFIYHRSGRKPTTEDDNLLHVDNIRSQDDYVPNNSNWMWTDNPQGVDNDIPEHKYEWMAFRIKMDPTHPDYDSSHPEWKWSHWSTIRIWSAYGDKGMDGDGIEYVYKREWSGKPEEVDHPSEDFIPTIANPTPDAPSGPIFIYGEDSSIGQEGIEQSWNKGVYPIVNSDPNDPNNWRPEGWDGGFSRWKTEAGTYNGQGEWVPKGWKDDPQGVDENHKKEYVSQRKRVNGVWGSFSTPTVWATFSKEHKVEIGEDGYWYIDDEKTRWKAEGEDGKGIDLKGRVDFLDSYHEEQFMQENPDFSFEPGHIVTYLKDVDDETSDDFRDPEVGDCYVVTYNGHIYLYVGGEDADWTKHWHNFGEFQGEGAYVHIAWAEWIGYNSNNELTSSGFVLNREVGNTVDYSWMGICTDNNRNDPDARIDPANLAKYKWNYVHGQDGDNIERVFIRTAVEVAPELEYEEDIHGVRTYPEYPTSEGTKTYQSQEYLPFVANPVDDNTVNPPVVGCQPDGNSYVDSLGKFQFSDDPMGGVTADLPYLWISERKKRDGEWKYFSTPSLHATYSHNGQSIVRSTIFRRWSSLTQRPPTPSPGLGNFYYPSGEPEDPDWKDGIPAGTGAIWKSERIFTSDGRPPQWDSWSTPTLVRDDDNYDVELSNQPRNVTPIPPIDYNETGGNRHDPSGTDSSGYDHSNENPPGKKQLWFDPELDATYITNNYSSFNWMATRTKFVNSSDLPEWRPWTIVLIKGEDGETGPAGVGFQHAYIVIDGDAVPNIVPNPRDNPAITTDDFVTTATGTSGYWTLDTTSGLSVGPNQYLWMSERSVSVNGYGPWGDPVKLSGNGTPGEDAEDIEFIYKRSDHLPDNSSNSLDKPSEENGKNGKTYDQDDFVPIGWEDNPQGVGYFTEQNENNQNIEVFYKYEWMCQRIKPRTSDIVDPDNPWGHWSRIFVWSAYGDTGMDGDGIEYIYTRDAISAGSAPSSPKAITSTHSNGIVWKGGVYLDSTDNKWKPKDLPTSEGTFNSWYGGEYNPQGEWIPGGSYDDQGQFVEGDWTDEPKGVGEEYQEENPNWDSSLPDSLRYITKYRNLFEWVSQRKRVNGEWGEFSEPTLWSSFAISPDLEIINGVWYLNGEPIGQAEGPAGKGVALKGSVDVIYHVEAGPGQIALQDIYPHQDSGGTWHYKDIAPGDCYVVRKNGHLYLCLHSYSGENAWNYDKQTDYTTGDGKTWLPTYTNPGNTNPNWEDVGEFKGEGSYMHIAWAATNDNIYGTGNITFDTDGKISLIKHYLVRYEDKLPEIDYDWMGVFADNDDDDPPCNFQTGDWIDNVLSTQNWYKYKWNNVRGRDGDNYERVYLRSKTATAPRLGDYHEDTNTITFDPYYDDEFPETEGQPRTFQNQEYLPKIIDYSTGNYSGTEDGRCTDDPVSVEESWPYSWMSERRKKLNPTTHIVEWFDFSPPALWAKYSFNGNDGKSVQTRYVAVPKKTGLTIDQGYESALSPVSTVEGTPYTWQPNTSSYSSLSTGMYLWMTQRSTSDPDNDITTEWEIPIRLSGEDGKAGEDGADIEFVYLRNNDAASPPAPANPTAKNKSNNRTTPYYGDVEKVGNAWIPKTWDTENNDAWSNWEWYSSAGTWNNDGEWIPNGWSDNPQGVDSAYKYEWACQRTKSSGTNQNWTQWIGPFKWSAYGDTGMDGDGVEYVYFRWDDADHPLATPPIPTALVETSAGAPYESVGWRGKVRLKSNYNPENDPDYVIQSDDWIPVNWPSSNGTWKGWDPNYGIYNSQGEWRPIVKVIENGDAVEPEDNTTFYWTDDPQGVGFFEEVGSDEPKLYIKEWVSVRKRIDGEWKDFSKPKVWASYGTDIYIDPTTGEWVVNGHPTGKKAEGKDGTGVALKDSVDFLSYKDKTDYVNDQEDLTQEEKDELMSELTSLQEIYPTSSNAYKDIQPGDCYVVRENRHLFVSLHDREHWVHAEYSAELSTDWRYTQNWEDFGEFQGEGSYMHIAWASSDAIQFNSSGTEITRVHPFICRFEDLQENVNYDWMGVYTDNIKEDYADNLDDNGNITDGSGYANWKYYKWNHVKGRDGSMHERVYIRTSKYDENHKPTIQNDYSPTGNYQNSEYYPFISNGLDCGAYNSGTANNPIYRCTDDPVGVSAAYPYEWMSERHKTWNNSHQSMLWGTFSAPSLWATYSFDGMSATINKPGDRVIIDAAGNIVGGLGTWTTNNFKPRLYTQVSVYDPKINNGAGGNLTYQNNNDALEPDKYKLSIVATPNSSHFVHTISPSGVIYITTLGDSNNDAETWRLNQDECKLDITVNVYGGKTFNFVYTLTLEHSPQTYLTYTLTNDSDTYTYRTRTGKYDGLPVSTVLEVLTVDGTPHKLNESTNKSTGYIKNLSVKSNLLDCAYTNKNNLTNTYKVSNSTLTTADTGVNSSSGNLTLKTKTAYICKDNGEGVTPTLTNLKLVIKTDGSVELVRDAENGTDVDLPDASHDMEISCTAVLGDVTYNSLKKIFKVSEKNDTVLYKLVLSGDSFLEQEDGTYDGEDLFSVSVNVYDDSGGVTNVIPTDGKIRDNVYVRYINGPSSTPENDTLLNTCPRFSQVTGNSFTVLVVEYNSSGTPAYYHDVESVELSPYVAPISQTYIDILPTQFDVNCNSLNEVISTRTLNISAYLRYGDQICENFTIEEENDGISITHNLTGTSIEEYNNLDVGDDGEVTKTFVFNSGLTLYSGEITIVLSGYIDGVLRTARGTISVTAVQQGDPGDKGDFKATAFIRTSTDISTWQPTGLNSTTNCPTGFSGHTIPSDATEGWTDGIPSGDLQLWASTRTIKGNGTTTTWSNPRKMTDTQYYDVEFSNVDVNPGNPTNNEANWFDPKSLKYRDWTASNNHVYSGNWKDVYWRAEKEKRNGVWDPTWTILRIKGESEPNVKADISSKTIETDPTGKLSSEYTFSFTTQLFVAGIAQVTTTNTCPNPNNNVVKSIQGGTFNTTNNSITWTVTIKGGVVLSNVDLQITMANSTYTDSLTFPIIFINKNRSKFKSTVFTRTNIDISSTRPTGGDYGSPKPTSTVSMGNGNTNSWYDGIPSGSAIIWASSRTFSSDGQDQDASWSYPREMSDTDTYDVEFSDQDSNTDLGTPATQPSKWFDPKSLKYRDWTASNNHVYTGNWEDVYWRAEKEIKNGEEGNWVVVRIKGETGDTGTGISSITPWYKAFDTLDVVIPSAGNETDGWTEDDDLTDAGWTDSYIKPTKENPYLWKFIRTKYEHPSSVVHSGLEMIQVWSENMINPNLLDDTDFIDDNHMNAWKSGSQATVSYNWGDCVCEHVFNTNNEYSSSLPSPYQNQRLYGGYCKEASSSYSDGGLVVLKQNIYVKEDKISKISPGQWYTLSFWLRGSSTYSNTSLNFQIESKYSSGSTETTLIDTNAGIYTNDVRGTSKNIGFSYNSTNNELVPNTSSTHAFKNVWKKFIITFKIKDTISENFTSAHFEWTLNPSTSYRMGFWISMPKLEIGKVATDYISSSAIRDPYPRLTVWAPGKQYYQGKYGEPYLDAVTYGANWFRCRNTHLSSESNKPFSGQTTLYWEPAQNLDFIATNLLLAETAVIDNLIATSLRTGERGVIPHVEMSGSRIEFYGTGMNPSIRFNVDTSGTGILEFLDNDGNVLYNLGPNGITRLVDAMNSTYANSALYKITSSTYVGDLITMSGNAINPSITGSSFNITDKYTLTEGYQKVGGVIKYRISNDSSPSAFNGRMFDGDQPSDSTLSQYLANNNAEDYSTLFSDETNWYITLNYGPILSFSAINGDDVVYTMKFHQYSKGRLSKTVTIYFSETEVRTAASNLRQLYGHRIVNNVVNSNLKILPLLNL